MALSEETIRKRLSGLNTSQDSIQTASLWIMHYKDLAIDKVTKCWMDIYKKALADDQLRIALIYVMNDVVQKVNKKPSAEAVKMAFHPHVVNACGLANNVKKPILRVIDVFADREIFPLHIIEEMRAALGISKRRSKEHSEFDENFTEVDHCIVIREIESYYQNEELTEKARNILERSDFNFKEKMQDRMKDRVEGTKILSEMDESKNKLVQFLNSVERHQNKCQRLVELLKSAKLSLNLQLRDVTIVDDAYEKFASGILETKKQLEAMLSSDNIGKTFLPEPVQQSLNDGGSSDDMEMDEEDLPPSANTSLILPKDYVAPVTTSSSTTSTSTLDPRLQRFLNENKSHLNKNEQREIESVIDITGGNKTYNNSSPLTNDPRQKSRASKTSNNDKHQKVQRHSDISLLTPTTSNASVQIFSPAASMNAMTIEVPPPSTSSSINIFSSLSIGPTSIGSSSQGSAVSPTTPIGGLQNPLSFSYSTGASYSTHLPPPHLLPPPPDFSMPPPFMSTLPSSTPDGSSNLYQQPSVIIPQILGVSSANAISPSNVIGSHFVPTNVTPLSVGSGFSNSYHSQQSTPQSGQKRKYSDNGDNKSGNKNFYDSGNDNWNGSGGSADNRWEKRSSSFHNSNRNNSGNGNWKRGGGSKGNFRNSGFRK